MARVARLNSVTKSSTIDARSPIPHHWPMKLPPGAIDCDIHPAVPSTAALLPYLADYWTFNLPKRLGCFYPNKLQIEDFRLQNEGGPGNRQS